MYPSVSCRSRGHQTSCSRSSILNDRRSLRCSCPRNFQETCRSLPLWPVHRAIPQNWGTALRRRGSTLKNHQSAAHDNRVSLKHTPWKYAAAVVDRRMCETIGRTRLLRASSSIVNIRLRTKIDDKIVQKKVDTPNRRVQNGPNGCGLSIVIESSRTRFVIPSLA